MKNLPIDKQIALLMDHPFISVFEYDKSWTWLMPVVGKLNRMDLDKEAILLRVELNKTLKLANILITYNLVCNIVEIINKNNQSLK